MGAKWLNYLTRINHDAEFKQCFEFTQVIFR